jgi:hypothetical protein
MGWTGSCFIEGVAIPDPEHAVKTRDLSDLISLVTLLVRHLWGATRKRLLLWAANCDFMTTLANHFPEIAALRK